jgi:hypothetical protein
LSLHEVGYFFGRQLDDRLVFACIAQKHPRGLILHFWGKGLHLLKSLHEQFGHDDTLRWEGHFRTFLR